MEIKWNEVHKESQLNRLQSKVISMYVRLKRDGEIFFQIVFLIS